MGKFLVLVSIVLFALGAIDLSALMAFMAIVIVSSIAARIVYGGGK